jgi:dCMP deaminase
MKQKFIDSYMKTAEVFAELSSAQRLHVGAIVVKDDRIISIGYNGMPAGWDNNCEDEYPISAWGAEHEKELNATYTLKTKPEVLHAETNAIAKLAKSNDSGANATLFVTHAPCLDCAKLVYQSGINNVFYRNSYRSDDGIRFLEKAGVQITQV